jgi:hypothetical protein
MKCDAPRAERPMVPIHGVGEFARFGARQCVADVAIWVKCKSVNVRKENFQLCGSHGEKDQEERGPYGSGYFSSLW